MANLAKPVTIILAAVVIAGGAGLFMARRSTPPLEETPQTSSVSPSGGGRFKGPEKAAITLLEFADFQCPSCAVYFPIVKEVMRRYPTQLRLEFHHYPLVGLHPFAMPAALAAEAAGDQGKFWEMHDKLYENQAKWSAMPNAESEFLTYASELGLNINQFMQSMRSPDTQQRILSDVTRAREAKAPGTPSFYINGKRIETPKGVNEFSQVIQEHLPK